MQTSDEARGARRLRLPRRPAARLALAALALAALAVPAAWASDRFADVPTGNPHHNDINTIARAGITLGCNPPANNLYCPGDAVTRQQMGSFLARTLRTLTPAVVGNSGAGAIDIDANPVVCQTDAFTPSVAALAIVHGSVSLLQSVLAPGDGRLDYLARLVASTDGGTTWSSVSPVLSRQTTVTPGAWSNTAQTWSRLVSAGSTIRFGLQLFRNSPGSAEVHDSYCQVLADFRYRDAGASSIGSTQ